MPGVPGDGLRHAGGGAPAYSNSADRVAVPVLGRKLYLCDDSVADVQARLSEGTLFENAAFN